jgi:hypothetical protein
LLACLLACLLVCLFGWLVGWWVGWLVGWLFGCLVVRFFWCGEEEECDDEITQMRGHGVVGVVGVGMEGSNNLVDRVSHVRRRWTRELCLFHSFSDYFSSLRSLLNGPDATFYLITRVSYGVWIITNAILSRSVVEQNKQIIAQYNV